MSGVYVRPWLLVIVVMFAPTASAQEPSDEAASVHGGFWRVGMTLGAGAGDDRAVRGGGRMDLGYSLTVRGAETSGARCDWRMEIGARLGVGGSRGTSHNRTLGDATLAISVGPRLAVTDEVAIPIALRRHLGTRWTTGSALKDTRYALLGGLEVVTGVSLDLESLVLDVTVGAGLETEAKTLRGLVVLETSVHFD